MLGVVYISGDPKAPLHPQHLTQEIPPHFWVKTTFQTRCSDTVDRYKGPTPPSRAPLQQDHWLGGHDRARNLFTNIDALTVFQEQMFLKWGNTSRLNPALVLKHDPHCHLSQVCFSCKSRLKFFSNLPYLFPIYP